LGDDLYRLDNIPFFAYGLNYRDIVRAVQETEDTLPEIKEVVQASGYQTVRLYFEEEENTKIVEDVLRSIKPFGISYERAEDRFIALNVKPESDLPAVIRRLEEYTQLGLLEFETCEARVFGSFDDDSD